MMRPGRSQQGDRAKKRGSLSNQGTPDAIEGETYAVIE
jgi:hypothetical protein